MDRRYRVETLPNGFIRVDDRESGLVGLWNTDGTPRHGDLTRSSMASAIGEMIRRQR